MALILWFVDQLKIHGFSIFSSIPGWEVDFSFLWFYRAGGRYSYIKYANRKLLLF